MKIAFINKTFCKKIFYLFAFFGSLINSLISCNGNGEISNETSATTTVLIEHTVTFLNYDNTLLFVDTVYHGESAKYEGDTPSKPSTEVYTYTFDGWDKDISFVTEDMTVKAVFREGLVDYDFVLFWQSNTMSITKYKKREADVVVPSSFIIEGKSYTVNEISKGAFANKGFLRSIELPDTIEYIRENAFQYCNNLRFVNFNKESKLSLIGDNAFDYCESLESFDIPDSVTSIGNNAFSRCATLKTIIIPKNVSKLGEGSFSYCSSLESVVFEEESKLNKIEESLFHSCERLNGISLPLGVFSIGMNAFRKCTSLSTFIVPSSVEKIEKYAFGGCTNLNSVTFEEDSNLESIGDYVFEKCISLTSFVIPKSVVSIGEHAFAGCELLDYIIIPKGVTNVGANVFFECKYLVVYCEASSASENWSLSWNGQAIFYWNVTEEQIIEKDYCQYLIIDNKAVLVNYLGQEKEVIIPSYIDINKNIYDVISIGNSAFKYSESLEKVEFSNESKLTSIGVEAFMYCSALKEITFPKSLTKIDDRAFFGCISLSSVFIPKNVSTIGISAFESNKLLKSVIFEEGSLIDLISWSIFEGCQSLESIFIPEKVTKIESHAFENCYSLKNILFVENSKIDYIGTYAFRYCRSLNSIFIPSEVIKIDYLAFQGCSNLYEVTIGENSKLEEIGRSAFLDCFNLFSIEIPKLITDIKEETFSGCKKLQSISFAENSTLKNIERRAFNNCESLRSIILPKSIEYVEIFAFEGCKSLVIYFESKAILSINETKNCPIYENVDKENVVIVDEIQYLLKDNFATLTKYHGNNKDLNVPSSIIVNEKKYEVTKIGNRAFYYDEVVESIFIPETVEIIEKEAFYHSYSLKNIKFSDKSKLNRIEEFAFCECSYLVEIYFPNQLTHIDELAFAYCTSLRKAEFSKDSSISYIGSRAFGTSGLFKFYIPKSVNEIGENIFENCHFVSVYCETENKPSGWNELWNTTNVPVYWDCSFEEYLTK